MNPTRETTGRRVARGVRERLPPLSSSPNVSRLIWYAGFYSATAGALKLAGFVLFLGLARALPVAEYASFGLLYAVQTGVATFALAGVVESVVGYIKDHPAPNERTALYATASGAFAVTATASMLFAWLAFMLSGHLPTIGTASLVCALGLGALLAFASLEAQLVRLEEQHLVSVLFSVGAPLAGFAGGFGGFLARRTVEAFFVGSLLGVAVALAFLWPWRKSFRHAHARTIAVRDMLTMGAPFVIVALFGWLNSYGNNYLVSWVFRPTDVARFTFTLTLSSILQLVAAALNQVWSPRFYQITHQAPIVEVERKNLRFYGAQAVALGLVGGVIVALFPLAMRVLGGNLVAYQSMGLELALLLGYYVLAVPVWHCQNYFMAYGRGKEFMRMTVVTGVIGFIAWIALMRVLGPIGIYVGFVAQVVLRLAGSIIAARKHWALTISWGGVAAGMVLIFAGLLFSRL